MYNTVPHTYAIRHHNSTYLPVCLLVCEDAGVGRHQGSVEGGRAVHVLGRVLEIALALVLIDRGVDWNRLQ